MLMLDIAKKLEDYEASLCKEIDIIALRNRNPIAHKWKVTYQSMCLRESVAWRFINLIKESFYLYKNEQSLGARILLRSALETLAILIRLNQLTDSVIQESINFPEYMKKIVNLLGGSRDGSTQEKATNIITIFEKCEADYPGMVRLYEMLSESAHPNYEGMRILYSETDPKNMITRFSNRANFLYSEMHCSAIGMALNMYDREYTRWYDSFVSLEIWLEKNSAQLEKYKSISKTESG